MSSLNLKLSKTYQADISLSQQETGGISFKSDDEIALNLQPILRGLPGEVGSRYTHTQSSAAAVWTVAHNLNIKPAVMVADHLDRQIFADVEWIDLNTVRVTHGSSITGKVYCN